MTGQFAVATDAEASGGQYIAAPANVYASAPDLGPGGDYVQFDFDVVSSSTFRLDA